jgi:2-keto-3-deoxy-L-rhamnonate aldolase RhmA
MTAPDNPFIDDQGNPRRVRGVGVNSGSPAIASLAAQVGFDVVWVEMEHAATHLERVDAVCLAAEFDGAVPLTRVPDGRRHHVLGALEAGARIVVVPMTNTVEQARLIVEFGKYPPVGLRGFNSKTRNLGFGLTKPLEAQARANRRCHLFAQIETLEAVENVDAMCRIEGLAGIFMGPADLSVSMGMTGQVNDPKVITVVVDCLKRAKAAGKLSGIMVGPGPLLDATFEAGAELVVCAGDLMNLAAVWPKELEAIPAL